MKSYRCQQCGLQNWTTVEFCKRCQSPNPYNQNLNSTNSSAPATTSFNTQINYQNPPPPNVYGKKSGSASQNQFAENLNFRNDCNYPFQKTLPVETIEKLRKVEKDINNAWLAGQTWSIIIVAFFVVFATVFTLILGKQTDSVAIFIILLMLALAGVIYALSYGIKQKNRACVIILLTLTSLNLLANLLTIITEGKINNVMSFTLSIVLTYYFAVGTQGMFTYYNLKQQYPDLVK